MKKLIILLCILVGHTSTAQNRIKDFTVLDTTIETYSEGTFVIFQCIDDGLDNWEFFVDTAVFKVAYYLVEIASEDNILDKGDKWMPKGTQFKGYGYVPREILMEWEKIGKYFVVKHDVKGKDGYNKNLETQYKQTNKQKKQ